MEKTALTRGLLLGLLVGVDAHVGYYEREGGPT